MIPAALTHEISPADGRGERRAVALLALGIFALWAVGIVARRVAPAAPALASHQRSAFAALDARDQGLFNDLRAAAEEIRARHTPAAGWPEPATLAAEAVPPFAPDAVWAQRGRLVWQRLDAHGPTHSVYWGRNATVEWALVLSGEATTVWRRAPKPDGAIPQAIPEMLVLDGWIEFVARKAVP
jgi:hypothetical protein